MKRLISLILIMIFILALSISPVHASETEYEKLLADVNKTNEKIDKMIYKAVEKVEKATDKEEKIDKIIDKLIDGTNKEAAKTKNKADDNGFEVICELVEVEIGGQKVLIDPLRILGF